MPNHPSTPYTVQITRHWHGEFTRQASRSRQDEALGVFERKMGADAAEGMAEDLLTQLQCARAVFGQGHAMFVDETVCPVKDCGQHHAAVPGEETPAPDTLDSAITLYNNAKEQAPEHREGALMIARQAVLRAAEFELKRSRLGTTP
jgi:hypothetical protein